MSKRTAARRRATPANASTLQTISQAVSANAGSVGRQAAAVVAASGLVLSIGLPAQGADHAVRASTSIPAPGVDIERAAAVSAVNVIATKDVEVTLDRAPVDSTPAPAPEPVVETAPERPAPSTAETPVAPAQAERTVERASQVQPAAERVSQTQRSSEAQAERAAQAERQERAERVAHAERQERAAQTERQERSREQGGGLSGVVSAAYRGVGVPYVYGGKTASGWDCSGFTSWAYRQAGISIPSSTSAMRASGLFAPTSSPKPGDLVFQNGGGHVGIYVGNGQMIGAQNPSTGTFLHSVSRNPLYGYYTYVG